LLRQLLPAAKIESACFFLYRAVQLHPSCLLAASNDNADPHRVFGCVAPWSTEPSKLDECLHIRHAWTLFYVVEQAISESRGFVFAKTVP
jgi:hypothetical protein